MLKINNLPLSSSFIELISHDVNDARLDNDKGVTDSLFLTDNIDCADLRFASNSL